MTGCCTEETGYYCFDGYADLPDHYDHTQYELVHHWRKTRPEFSGLVYAKWDRSLLRPFWSILSPFYPPPL